MNERPVKNIEFSLTLPEELMHLEIGDAILTALDKREQLIFELSRDRQMPNQPPKEVVEKIVDEYINKISEAHDAGKPYTVIPHEKLIHKQIGDAVLASLYERRRLIIGLSKDGKSRKRVTKIVDEYISKISEAYRAASWVTENETEMEDEAR